MAATGAADGRLFEMGFASQFNEIVSRLPQTRQNLLFSATLPSSVAEFSKAGLVNPVLVRLDADQQISPDLRMSFLLTKSPEKDAVLVLAVDNILRKKGENGTTVSQAIIFVSTKHHVEYIGTLLSAAGYNVSRIYGSLDQTARQQQLQVFRSGGTNLLVVTDVAARGLDIPIVDHVINYDFPAGSRLFVHRVGRTARAGRYGSAWSLVTLEELPYLFDLSKMVGRPFVVDDPAIFGLIPQSAIDEKLEYISQTLDAGLSELASLRQVKDRGQLQFERSRTHASPSRIVRVESSSLCSIHVRPG